MAQTIKLKRSATQGAVPTTSSLALGEVAINTVDGKMYIKKDVAGTESIVEIGSGGGNAAAIWKQYVYTAGVAQTVFTGADDNSDTLAYSVNFVEVFLNGILLDPAVDYTATSTNSIVLTSAPATGDLLQIDTFAKSVGIGDTLLNSFTGDNSTTAFTLSDDPGDENNTSVFIGGVYQNKTTYSVSGTTLTFSEAPATAAEIEVVIGSRNLSLTDIDGLSITGVMTAAGGSSTNWNTAYGWGDHSTVGYTTTDTTYSAGTGVTLTGTTFSLTDTATKWTQDNTKISNWDTAYGWGDHSTVGYTTTDTTYSAGTGVTLTGTTFSLTDTATKWTQDNTKISNWDTAYGWGDHSTESYATQSYVGTAISNLVDSSPSTLDTLNELAAALGDDPNFATTTATALGLKAPIASPTFTGPVTLSGTSSIKVPVGTTAQRDGTPANGMFRYNSSNAEFEGYQNGDWGAIGGGGGSNTFTTDTFTGDGSTTAYALSQVISSKDNLLVFIEGVFQQQAAYSIATASGTTTLTFTTAPVNTRAILIYSVAGAVSGSNLNIDTMTGDNSTTTLALSIAPVNVNNTQVFLDGVYQNKSTYSISGTTLTFSTAPPTDTEVEVMTMTQTEINVPVDNTITTAKIVDGSVTSAKLADDSVTSAKLDTNIAIAGTITASGIDVIGTATMDGLTVEGDALAMSHTGNTSTISLTQKAGTQNSVATISANREDASTSASRLLFSTNDGTSTLQRMRIANNGDVSFYEDTGTTAKLFWDASAESLGIGTSAPASKLDIVGLNKDAIKIRSNVAPENYYQIGRNQSTGLLEFFGSEVTYNGYLFKGPSSDLMTINSSGHVGIGTSSPSSYYPGADNLVIYQASGEVGMTIATGNNSVGAIYFADSPTGANAYMGGIAYSHSNDQLTLVSNGAGRINIGSAGDITPATNNSMDLGASSAKFKDLYLSGGVYLGGTGAANHLDDYEEGTWAPNIIRNGGSIAATFTAFNSTYVKIGNIVYVKTYIHTMSNGSSDGTSYWRINGMPFAGSVESYTGTALGYNSSPADNCYVGDAGGNAILCVGSTPYSGAISGQFMLSFTYKVT